MLGLSAAMMLIMAQAGPLSAAPRAEAPLREDLVGKVGDDNYSADFPAEGIAQVARAKP